MENDVLLLVILVFIIFGIFMYILDKENTAKINKKLYGKLEDYPKEDLSFREAQEKREENFKQALREHGMPVLGDEKEEPTTKINKFDMVNISNQSLSASIENIVVFIGYLAKIFFIKIPLTLIGILLIIAGVALTITWIGFVFGSVIGVILLLIFCIECFLLPLAISALGLTIIAKTWDK